jgi:ATP/maltotriose-dependent transcriptional regulator MalT
VQTLALQAIGETAAALGTLRRVLALTRLEGYVQIVEVLGLIAAGLSNKQIAAELTVTLNTV